MFKTKLLKSQITASGYTYIFNIDCAISLSYFPETILYTYIYLLLFVHNAMLLVYLLSNGPNN